MLLNTFKCLSENKSKTSFDILDVRISSLQFTVLKKWEEPCMFRQLFYSFPSCCPQTLIKYDTGKTINQNIVPTWGFSVLGNQELSQCSDQMGMAVQASSPWCEHHRSSVHGQQR